MQVNCVPLPITHTSWNEWWDGAWWFSWGRHERPWRERLGRRKCVVPTPFLTRALTWRWWQPEQSRTDATRNTLKEKGSGQDDGGEMLKLTGWRLSHTCWEGKLNLLSHNLQGNKIVSFIEAPIVEKQPIPFLSCEPAQQKRKVKPLPQLQHVKTPFQGIHSNTSKQGRANVMDGI